MFKQDARAVRSRRALMDAGMELLMQNPQVTLSQIASHAGVGRATLYRQFETREQLIQALALESLQMIDEISKPLEKQGLSPLELLQAIVSAIMPLANRYLFLAKLWDIAEQDKKVRKLSEHQDEEIVWLINQAKKQGEIRDDLPSDWIARSLNGLIYAGWEMMMEDQRSAEEVAPLVCKTLLQGIQSTTNS